MLRLVVLRRNYRSRPPILDAAHRLIRHNDPDRLEVRAGIGQAAARTLAVCATRTRGGPVRLTGFATGSDEADAIAAESARPRSRPGPPGSTRSSCARIATPTRTSAR